MDDFPFPHIEWENLLARLADCAFRWFAEERCYGEDSLLPGTGLSPIDLVYGAVQTFVEKEYLNWKPKNHGNDPFPFIKTIMRHDFLDLVKDGREHKRTIIIDKASQTDDESLSQPFGLDDLPTTRDSFSSAEAAIVAQQVYNYTEGDTELTDLVDAVLLCGVHKREDIANLLGVTPQEITNRQRRLKGHLSDWRRKVLCQTKTENHPLPKGT